MPQVPGRRRATMCDLAKSTSGTPARRTSRRRSGSCKAPESPPVKSALNQWGHGGSWNVGAENGTLESAPEKIVFRFHSRDLHMVLGPGKHGTPVRFKVKLDGTEPGVHHGSIPAPTALARFSSHGCISSSGKWGRSRT